MEKRFLLFAWLFMLAVAGRAQQPAFEKVEWYDTCTFNPVTTNWEKKLVYTGKTVNTRDGAFATINLVTNVGGNPIVQIDTATVINNRFYKVYDYWFNIDSMNVEMRYLYPILSVYLLSGVSWAPYFNPATDTIYDQVDFGNEYTMCPVYYWKEIRDCRTMNVVWFTDMDNDCYYDRFDDHHWHPEMAVYRNNVLDRIVSSASKFRRGLNLFDTNAVTNDEFLVRPLFNNATCLPGNEFRVRLDTLSGRNNQVQMGIQLSSTPDLILQVHSAIRVQSSFSYVTLEYFNNYTGSRNAHIEYTIPDNYDFVSTSHTNYTIAGNVITFNLGTLPPAAHGRVDLRLRANSVPRQGDTVLQAATIFPVTGDAVPSNNTYSKYETVLSSWDPNQKTSIPEHYLADATAPIRYIIDFENLGNDTAFYVYILDTLSALLDVSTLKIIGATHKFDLDLDASGSRYVLKLRFNDIGLPGRNRTEYNKGYLIYEIAPKAGLRKGQQIENTAHIFFDYNDPVVTNTTLNELHPNGITSGQAAIRLNIHPNPVQDVIRVDNLDGMAIRADIYDVTGRKAGSYSLEKGVNAFDVSAWSAGVYVIKCTAPNGETRIFKIVKE